MEPKLVDILDECIYLIKSKKDTVEGCLARHPHLRKELQPLLTTSAVIQAVPPATISSTFKETLRSKLVEATEARQTKEIMLTPGLLATVKNKWVELGKRTTRARSIMIKVVILLLAVLLAGSGTVAASANSMPGSLLYPVKLATEQVQLALASSNVNQAEMHLKFASLRLNEIKTLVTEQKTGDVDTPLANMNQHLKQAQSIANKLSYKDRQELYSKILKFTQKQQAVLKTVLAKVPDQAKDAIKHALEVSQRGCSQAESALKKETPKPPESGDSQPDKKTPSPSKPTNKKTPRIPADRPKDSGKESYQDSQAPLSIPVSPRGEERL